MVVHLSAFHSREQRRYVLPSHARVAAMVQPRDGEILIREELRLGIACGPSPDGKPRGEHDQQRRWFDARFARPGEIAGTTNAGAGLIRWPVGPSLVGGQRRPRLVNGAQVVAVFQG